MTVEARRLPDELVADDVARAAAHLESVGFMLVPLLHPVAHVWPLLAVSPRGLTLVAVVREKPNVLGTAFGLPPGWPESTVRLILVWPTLAPLPRAITL